MADSKVYLQGPENLTMAIVSRIEKGEVRSVSICLLELEVGYRTRPFEEFARLYLKPAMAQLFSQENQPEAGQ